MVGPDINVVSKPLLDKDFAKPQAFHKLSVTRSGGIAIQISLLIFIGIYNLLYSEILYDYIFISLSLFFIGFCEDIKIEFQPKIRLVFMMIALFLIIYFLPINIYKIDLFLLKSLLTYKLFSTCFVILCFVCLLRDFQLGNAMARVIRNRIYEATGGQG